MAGPQHLHNLSVGVITAGVVVTAKGAFQLLAGRHEVHVNIIIRADAIAVCLTMAALGERPALNSAEYQPAAVVAIEGLF